MITCLIINKFDQIIGNTNSFKKSTAGFSFLPTQSRCSRRLYPRAAPFIIQGYRRMGQLNTPPAPASASVNCSRSSWTAPATWLHEHWWLKFGTMEKQTNIGSQRPNKLGEIGNIWTWKAATKQAAMKIVY